MSLMRTIVVPLFYAAGPATLTGTTFAPPLRVWVRDSTRAKAWPLLDWRSLSVDLGKWGDGAATIEVNPTDYWLSQSGLGITSPEYGFGVSFDVYWQDMTTPLFSGPVESVELRETRDGESVVFTCSTFWQHLLTRRLEQSTDGSKLDLTSAQVDYVIYSMLDRSGYDTSIGIVSSTSYPGSTDRQDFGDWTVATDNVSSPGDQGTTINHDVSDGRRVLEEIRDLLEAHDMALTLTESPAGTFTYTVVDTYENNDYSSTIVLDLRRGTSSSYSETIDYSALENVIQVKGSGSGGSQLQSWQKDSTSVTNYGVFEGSYTYNEADANALSDAKSDFATKFAGPQISYAAGAIDQPGATFQVDYTIRDLVTIRGGAWSRGTTKTVTGCKLSASGRDVSCAIVLGDPSEGYTKLLERGAGLPLGRGRGQSSKFKAVSGN